MRKINLYQCEICFECYNEWNQAKECEKIGIEKIPFKIGDIVEARYGFGWFDGNKKWIINPNIHLKVNGKKCPEGDNNCFGSCCTYGFYYVITALENNPDNGHQTRIHLATKAMTGQQGYAEGYTHMESHIAITLIKNPPKFIIKDSKDLIGKKSKYLI